MFDAMTDTAADCRMLVELQVRRKAMIQHIGTAERRFGALARLVLGWRFDMPEKERAALNKAAEKLTRAMLSEKELSEADADFASRTYLDVDAVTIRASLVPLWQSRKQIERQMENVAARLPAAGMVADTRGFGIRGLAVIIGETGDLSDYPNPAKVWRRLGLAPYTRAKDGLTRAGSTWRMKGGLSADEWSDFGYAPARLGQIYGVNTEPLMKMNDGKYRALYLHAKAAFAPRAERPMHAHKHAMRLMTKELVLDVWRAWRGLPQRDREALQGAGGGHVCDDAHEGIAPAPEHRDAV
jgi:hypothetical protein